MVVLHFPRVSRFVMIIYMIFLSTMIQLKHDISFGSNFRLPGHIICICRNVLRTKFNTIGTFVMICKDVAVYSEV